MIYAAGALAGDDSLNRQCTEVMFFVRVYQAYPRGVPSTAGSVRQIQRGKVLTVLSEALDCQFEKHLHAKKGFLCMHEDKLSYIPHCL